MPGSKRMTRLHPGRLQPALELADKPAAVPVETGQLEWLAVQLLEVGQLHAVADAAGADPQRRRAEWTMFGRRGFSRRARTRLSVWSDPRRTARWPLSFDPSAASTSLNVTFFAPNAVDEFPCEASFANAPSQPSASRFCCTGVARGFGGRRYCGLLCGGGQGARQKEGGHEGQSSQRHAGVIPVGGQGELQPRLYHPGTNLAKAVARGIVAVRQGSVWRSAALRHAGPIIMPSSSRLHRRGHDQNPRRSGAAARADRKTTNVRPPRRWESCMRAVVRATRTFFSLALPYFGPRTAGSQARCSPASSWSNSASSPSSSPSTSGTSASSMRWKAATGARRSSS